MSASNSGTNRIDSALSNASTGLWPFIAAGYPCLEITEALLKAMNGLPIRGVELGIPFYDPIADGPVIQHVFSKALDGGITLSRIFEMVSKVRSEIDYPLLAMVSASIVYRVEIEPFVKKAGDAGFDGFIVPDISLEEAPTLAKSVGEQALRLSMLVAPTTPADRQERIAAVASGFLYYVSIQGTTGARNALPADLESQVRALKASTSLPVLIGFGISRSEHVKEVCRYADGAIVGSAIVRKISDSVKEGKSNDALVEDVTGFIHQLATG